MDSLRSGKQVTVAIPGHVGLPGMPQVKQEADLSARNKRCGHPLDFQLYWFQTSHHPLFFGGGGWVAIK